MTILLHLLACEDTPPPCALPARPAAEAVAGDVNGDGAFDIADAAATADASFRGGKAITCEAAGDIVPDGSLDGGDSVAMLYSLFSGTTADPPEPSGCAAESRDAACGDGLAWSFDGPDDATSPASVFLHLTTGPLSVSAWSASIAAEGCTLTAASVAGTASADVLDDPPGSRDGGFTRFDPVEGGLVAAVVYRHATDAALPPSESLVSVLGVAAELEGSTCGTCTLRLTDGLEGPGKPVRNVVAAEGRAYTPASASFSFHLCPAVVPAR